MLYEDNMVKTEQEKSEEYLEFRKVSQIWAFWEKCCKKCFNIIVVFIYIWSFSRFVLIW